MKITIVIDDPDPTAATEAARTISRAFVRTGSTESVSGVDADGPAVAAAPALDVDAGPAPRFDVAGPSSSGSTSDPGSQSGGNGSTPSSPPPRPAMPNPSRPPGGPVDESAGAAPEHGGGR